MAARGLARLLDDDRPTILAWDFNTWFGYSDRACIETARACRAEFRRAASRFGPDHYPLVGSLQFN